MTYRTKLFSQFFFNHFDSTELLTRLEFDLSNNEFTNKSIDDII